MKPGDDASSLTILGSGTCVPSLKRSACAVLVKTRRSRILLDAGPGTMHRLLEADTTILTLGSFFSVIFIPTTPANLFRLYLPPSIQTAVGEIQL